MNLRFRLACAVTIVAVVMCSCAQTPAPAPSQPVAQRPTVVFMTDFGTANDAVAICKAVMLGVSPDLRIMDITHQVTPFSIEEGARNLESVSPYYPAGTVFVAVIDPGVGTARKAIIVKTKKNQYFVVPDNGLMTPVLQRDGLDSAREITNQSWMIQAPVSSTFHGRDIFSPAAAHLASGWDFNAVGPVVENLVTLTVKTPAITPTGIDGHIIGLDDPFGSLITDIPGDEFKKLGYVFGDRVPFHLDNKKLTYIFVKTFGDAPLGATLLYIDSRGRLGVAINQGNYSKKFNYTPPGTIFVPRKTTK